MKQAMRFASIETDSLDDYSKAEHVKFDILVRTSAQCSQEYKPQLLHVKLIDTTTRRERVDPLAFQKGARA